MKATSSQNKNLVWDKSDKTIRGSFINLVLTLFFCIIIWEAVHDQAIMERVTKLSEIIIGVYLISLGVWKTGSLLKYNKDKTIEVECGKKKEEEEQA